MGTYSGLQQRRAGFVVKQALDPFASLIQASRFSVA